MTENYKRQYRELSDETKEKISRSLKGKSHNAEWRYATSQALKKYWATVPSRDEQGDKKLSMTDIMM